MPSKAFLASMRLRPVLLGGSWVKIRLWKTSHRSSGTLQMVGSGLDLSVVVVNSHSKRRDTGIVG